MNEEGSYCRKEGDCAYGSKETNPRHYIHIYLLYQAGKCYRACLILFYPLEIVSSTRGLQPSICNALHVHGD